MTSRMRWPTLSFDTSLLRPSTVSLLVVPTFHARLVVVVVVNCGAFQFKLINININEQFSSSYSSSFYLDAFDDVVLYFGVSLYVRTRDRDRHILM